MKFAQYVDVATLTTQSYRDIKNEILLLLSHHLYPTNSLKSKTKKKVVWCVLKAKKRSEASERIHKSH